MIFLVVAAILGMGGIVAYLAHEKGRSAVLWGIYGVLLAPVALPHILMARANEDDDGDVWAEIRHNLQNQSVNDQAPTMSKPDSVWAVPNWPEPEEWKPTLTPGYQAPKPQPAKAEIRKAPAQTADVADPEPPQRVKPQRVEPQRVETQRVEPQRAENPQAQPQTLRPQIIETIEQPPIHMFADKPNARPQPTRTEPSFTASAAVPNRPAANDFRIEPSDRLSGSGAPRQPQRPIELQAPDVEDLRSRAPLSADPDAPRPDGRGFGGPVVATVAVMGLVVVAVVALAPTLARYIPAGMPFSTATPEVKNVAAAGLTAPVPTDAGDTPAAGSASDATAAKSAPASSGSAFGPPPTQSDAKDVGTAKLATPIAPKSDPKAPPIVAPSSATETNLALATRGMKPVDVPNEPAKSAPAPVSEPAKAAPQPKPAAAAPAPAKPTAKAEAPKAETPKTEAPKAVAKAESAARPKAPKAAPEDFLSMLNKAIGPNGAAKSSAAKAATASASPSIGPELEQVSESNDLVLSVQRKLRERGYDPGTMDGRTGPKTVQAIRDYQQNNGLPADGLIDITLMERLGVVGKRLQFPSSR